MGPPLEKATWSGTPANLIASLAKYDGVELASLSTRLDGKTRRLARRLDSLYGAKYGSMPGAIQRCVSASTASYSARSLRSDGVLHFSTYDLPLWKSHIPRYLYVDNSFDIWANNSIAGKGLTTKQYKIFRQLEIMGLRNVNHIFTIGEHVAENFCSKLGVPEAKVTVVGSGMGGITPFLGEKDYRSGEILSVIKERPVDKGLPLLLEAFAIARESRPELKLTIIGGSKFKDYERGANVIFTGWMEQAELQQKFERASLFVLPATYEPWGLSYLEALACKTPIVGLNKNAFPEISAKGEFGYMLKSTDSKALADLMLSALSHPEGMEKRGTAGQEQCLARYDWDVVAQSILDVIIKQKRPAYL